MKLRHLNAIALLVIAGSILYMAIDKEPSGDSTTPIPVEHPASQDVEQSTASQAIYTTSPKAAEDEIESQDDHIRIARPKFVTANTCFADEDGGTFCRDNPVDHYEILDTYTLEALALTDAYAALHMVRRVNGIDRVEWQLRAVALSGKTEPLLYGVVPSDLSGDLRPYMLVQAAQSRIYDRLLELSERPPRAERFATAEEQFLERYPGTETEVESLATAMMGEIDRIRMEVIGEPLFTEVRQ